MEKHQLTPEEIAELSWWDCASMPDCQDVDVGRCIDTEDYAYCPELILQEDEEEITYA